jgi:hypothetical protein
VRVVRQCGFRAFKREREKLKSGSGNRGNSGDCEVGFGFSFGNRSSLVVDRYRGLSVLS